MPNNELPSLEELKLVPSSELTDLEEIGVTTNIKKKNSPIQPSTDPLLQNMAKYGQQGSQQDLQQPTQSSVDDKGLAIQRARAAQIEEDIKQTGIEPVYGIVPKTKAEQPKQQNIYRVGETFVNESMAQNEAVNSFFQQNEQYVGDAKNPTDAYKNIVENKAKAKIAVNKPQLVTDEEISAFRGTLHPTLRKQAEVKAAKEYAKNLEQAKVEVESEIENNYKKGVISQLPQGTDLRQAEKDLAEQGFRVDLTGEGKKSAISDFGSLTNSFLKATNNLGYQIQYYNPISIFEDKESRQARVEANRSKDIVDWNNKINQYDASLVESLESGDFANALGQTLNMTGESLPTMLAAGAATAYGNPYAGYALMSTLAAGETYLSVKNEDWFNKDLSDAGKFGYIAAVSLAEAGGEMLGGKVLNRVFSTFVGDATNAAAKKTVTDLIKGYAKGMGYNIKDEAIGEMLPAVTEYLATAIAKGEDITLDGLWDAAKEGAYAGIAMGGGLSAAGNVASLPFVALNQVAVRQYDAAIGKLKKDFLGTTNVAERQAIAEKIFEVSKKKNEDIQGAFDAYESMNDAERKTYKENSVELEATLDRMGNMDKNSAAFQIDKEKVNRLQSELSTLEQKYTTKTPETPETIQSNQEVTNRVVTSEADVLKTELKKIGVPDKIVNAISDGIELEEFLIADKSNIFESLKQSGLYSKNLQSGKEKITINKFLSSFFGGRDKILLHEAVHAATVTTIIDVQRNPENYDAETISAIEDLKSIAEPFIENTSESAKQTMKNLYGTTNISEFMAEFVSNKKFRDFIERTNPTKKTNIVNYIWGKILSTLGIKSVNSDIISEIENSLDKVYDASAKKLTDNKQQETLTPKKTENAIQKQKSDESLLREEQPQVGLQKVGKGNAKQEGAAKQGKKGGKKEVGASTQTQATQEVAGRKSPVFDAKNLTNEPTPTEEKAAEKVGITPKNLRDLYAINRDMFGQNKVKAFATAVVMDKMIGAMAMMKGVSKAKIYETLEFRKGDKNTIKELSKIDGVLKQANEQSSTIKLEYNEKGQHLAPNGKPSNLTEEQAKTVRTKAFKDWFGDWENDPNNSSQVIDSNGEPLVVYHGSKKYGFNEFKKKEGSSSKSKMQLLFGNHFASSIDDAKIYAKKSEDVYSVFLNIKNPIDLPRGFVVSIDKNFDSYLNLSKELGLDKKFKNNLDYEVFTKDGDYGGKSKDVQRVFITQSMLDSLPPKKVHDALVKHGFDGVFYEPYKPVGFNNAIPYSESYISFLPNQVKLADGTNKIFNPSINDIRFQGAQTMPDGVKFQIDAIKARGAMMMALDGKAIIYALTDPNVSTPLHELAHVFEHYLTPEQKASVLKWTGATEWSVEVSEKFARGFEKYLADGKAPTVSMQKIFDRFKEWLTDIYNGITGSEIDVELNDDMKALYGKMLGVDEVSKKKDEEVAVSEKKAKETAKALKEGFKLWLSQQKQSNIIFDPRSKAAQDMALTRLIINHAVAVGADTVQKIKDIIDNMTNGSLELTRDGAEYIIDLAFPSHNKTRSRILGFATKAINSALNAKEGIESNITNAMVISKEMAKEVDKQREKAVSEYAKKNSIKKDEARKEVNRLMNNLLAPEENNTTSYDAFLELELVSPSLANSVQAMRNQIDAVTKSILEDPAFLNLSPALRKKMEENLGNYTHREYLFFSSKNKNKELRRIANKLQINKDLEEIGFWNPSERLIDDAAKQYAIEHADPSSGMPMSYDDALDAINALIDDWKAARDPLYTEQADVISSADLKLRSGALKKKTKLAIDQALWFQAKKEAKKLNPNAKTTVVLAKAAEIYESLGGEWSDMPEYLRNLLGEIKDPVSRYINTITAMSAVLYKGKAMKDIIDNYSGFGWVSTKEPRTDKKDFILVDDKFSPIDGMWVHKNIINEFNQKAIYQTDYAVANAYFTVQNWFRRTKILPNPATWFKNVVGGYYGQVLNGEFYGLTNPSVAAKSLWGRLTEMTAGQRTEFMKGVFADAAEAGVLSSGVDVAVMGYLDDMFISIENRDFSQFEKSLSKLYHKSVNKVKSVSKEAGRRYSQVDDHSKAILVYSQKYDVANQIFDKDYDNLTDKERTEVLKETGNMVKKTMPTFSRLPSWFRTMSRIPFFGDFLSFKIEAIRSFAGAVSVALEHGANAALPMIDPRTEKEYTTSQKIAFGKSAAKRFAGITAIAALNYAVIRGLFDSDDDDEEKLAAERKLLKEQAMLNTPEWTVGKSLIYKGVDKNGNVKFLDYSGQDPYSDVITLVMGNTKSLSDIFKPSLTMQAFSDVWNGESGDWRLYWETDPWITKAAKSSLYLSENLVPPFISSSKYELDKKRKEQEDYANFSKRGFTGAMGDYASVVAPRITVRDYSYNVYSAAKNFAYKINKDYNVPDIKKVKTEKELYQRIANLKKMRDNYKLVMLHVSAYPDSYPKKDLELVVKAMKSGLNFSGTKKESYGEKNFLFNTNDESAQKILDFWLEEENVKRRLELNNKPKK